MWRAPPVFAQWSFPPPNLPTVNLTTCVIIFTFFILFPFFAFFVEGGEGGQGGRCGWVILILKKDEEIVFLVWGGGSGYTYVCSYGDIRAVEVIVGEKGSLSIHLIFLLFFKKEKKPAPPPLSPLLFLLPLHTHHIPPYFALLALAFFSFSLFSGTDSACIYVVCGSSRSLEREEFLFFKFFFKSGGWGREKEMVVEWGPGGVVGV